MEMPRVDISFDVALMALRADVDDLLLVLRLRHDFFFGLEVCVVTGGTNWIVAVVLLIFLEVITLLVFSRLLGVATLADDLHAQFFLGSVRTVTLFAVRNVFLTLAFEHLVKIFHPGCAYDLVAWLALHRLILREMRHVLEICAFLFVAIQAGHVFVNRTVQAVAADKYRLTRLRFQCFVGMTVQDIVGCQAFAGSSACA